MFNYKNPDLALFLLRIVLAVIFIAHGWGKFQNMGQTISLFGGLGLAPFFAYLVAVIEFFAGIAMLIGIYTDWAGVLLAIVMFFAIVLVKLTQGIVGGYELDLALLASALTVSLIGPGRFTAKKLMKK